MAEGRALTLRSPARAVLLIRLYFERYGGGATLAATVLAVGVFMWLVLAPGISSHVDREARRVAQMRSAPVQPRAISHRALAAERLRDFYSALGDAGHTERTLSRLFQAASGAGVMLDKGEYMPARDVIGRFDTYTITLPVKGDYLNIRRFCESVLLTTPYAALDDVRFKRSSVSEPDVKANLRFTMFLRSDAPVGVRGTMAGAQQ